MALSSDGNLVASSSQDNSIKFWDANTGRQQHTFLVEDIAKDLKFSTDDSFLNTSQGSFNLRPLYSRFVSLVGRGHHWIALQGKEMLWLPHEHRSKASVVRDGTVAIASNSGQVMFIELGIICR